MLKVLHLINGGHKIGGAEMLLIDIAKNSDKKICDLSFITLKSTDQFKTEISKKNWLVFSLDVNNYIGMLKGIYRANKIIEVIKPDIIHTHLHQASFLGVFLKKNIPLIHTRHYSDYMVRYGNLFSRRIDKFVATHSNSIIAVSSAVKNHLVNYEKVNAEDITVIHNGVNYQYLSSINRSIGKEILGSLGIQSCHPVIGSVGSLHKRKGHIYLIEAFRIVKNFSPQATLVIVGAGEEYHNLKIKIKSLGLENSVVLLGYRDDAKLIMSGFDIYVQPSIEEAFGIAVIEAMAMKIPVIVSKVGGLNEIVENDMNGLIVAKEDVRVLASAMIKLIDSEPKCRLLGEKASIFVKEHYSIEAMINKYTTLYENIISQKKKYL